MKRSDIRANIQTALAEDGVYRTDTFLDNAIDEGNGLVRVFSLCDERRSSINVDGSRNFNPVPVSGEAYCFAPLFVANANTGYRLSPVEPDQLELHTTDWEGKVGTDGGSMYYTYLNPYHSAQATLVCCPIQNIGRSQLTVIGAYIPADLTGDTDIPRFDESFHDLLVLYGTFYSLVSEPGMGRRAAEVMGQFVSRLNEFTATVRARFPSGRDFEPMPVEFTYENVTEQDRQSERSEGEGK